MFIYFSLLCFLEIWKSKLFFQWKHIKIALHLREKIKWSDFKLILHLYWLGIEYRYKFVLFFFSLRWSSIKMIHFVKKKQQKLHWWTGYWYTTVAEFYLWNACNVWKKKTNSVSFKYLSYEKSYSILHGAFLSFVLLTKWVCIEKKQN